MRRSHHSETQGKTGPARATALWWDEPGQKSDSKRVVSRGQGGGQRWNETDVL